MKRAVAACLLGCLSAGIALADPVGPGQAITVPAPNGVIPTPQGVQIASQTINFTADVTSLDDFLPGFVPNQQTVDGTLVNSVWRDSSGHLSFQYQVTSFPNYDDNLSEFSASNFAGFSTDFAGSLGTTIAVKRSADGKTVRASAGEGLGANPLVILATDATSFNTGGHATFIGDTDFVPGHNDQGQTNILDVQATANFSGLYQPTSSSVAAVPLPPAVYGGMAMFILVCGSQLRRRATKA